jgi:hypothetical protein
MTRVNLLKGMGGGFVGTIVLSAIMVMKSAMGLMPQFDMIGMLASMLGGSRSVAWVVHFLIGTVLWGGLFAWLDPHLPSRSHWLKGTLFGIGAWVVMMVVLMPMAGAGLFAVKLGMMVTMATLILHAVYGAVMGGVYGAQHPESGELIEAGAAARDLRGRSRAEQDVEGLGPAS